MKHVQFLIISILLLFLMGCGEKVYQPPVANLPPETVQEIWPELERVEAFPNLVFDQPVEFLHAGDDGNRVFVVEKTGKVIVFDNDPQVTASDIFIDLSSRVDSRASEKGLLGMAFHPNFTQNGLFYVNFTNNTHTVIARYQVNPDNPDQGLIDSEQVLITIPQPYANHNGGHLAFGPDGYLYIGTGDGGSAGDPQGNAQSLKSLLGKMLRIDVDAIQEGELYGIPADNPLVGNLNGYQEEIYAYGLRNPWKFSFDIQTGRLWAADVGQNTVEEIDLIEKGMNYGWNIMEGSLCYPASSNCSKEGLKQPIWEYRQPLGRSVTGGYVYRGSMLPDLSGIYVYGDFVTGLIWGLRTRDDLTPQNKLLMDSKLNISSFGVDESNELYILDLGGKIYKLKEIEAH